MLQKHVQLDSKKLLSNVIYIKSKNSIISVHNVLLCFQVI